MAWTIALLILPMIVLIVVAGIVVTVALWRATPEDVPLVMWLSSSVLHRLADRVPRLTSVSRLLDRQDLDVDAGTVVRRDPLDTPVDPDEADPFDEEIS